MRKNIPLILYREHSISNVSFHYIHFRKEKELFISIK